MENRDRELEANMKRIKSYFKKEKKQFDNASILYI